MIDAGPGEPGTSPAAAPEPQKTPPEPAERREEVSAVVAEISEHPADTPADDGAEPTKPETISPEAQQRIDRLTRERYEAIRQRDEMRAEYERWQQQQQQQRPSGSDDYERGRREAQEQRIVQNFNEACDNLFNRGVQEYGDEMTEARDRLNAVGWGNRADALAAVTQLPDGHRVYRELARDLDNAARVLSLPPMAMAVELARMSNHAPGHAPGHAPSAPREADGRTDSVPVTRAPEPVARVGGNSRQTERPLDHPQTSMAEFIRRRDRDERRSRIAR